MTGSSRSRPGSNRLDRRSPGILSSMPSTSPSRHDSSLRSGRASKKMTIIAVALMILALIGYVMSMDEELQPGAEGERVPAMAE